MKNKTMKKAMITSIIALVLCFAMLVGTTYAWFTDSVASSGNIIKSGTLNIDLLIKTDADQDYVSVKGTPDKKAFNYELWEPGYTEWVNAKVATTGNLALKYTMKIIANGQVSALADVIDVYYKPEEVALPATRDLSGLVKIGTLADALAGTIVINDTLIPGAPDTNGVTAADFATLALHMQESAGNEYQNLSIGTDFSLQILATQYTYEEDSFDNQYDANAVYPDVTAVFTSAGLTTALANNEDVALSNDIAATSNMAVNGSTVDGNGNDVTFGNTGSDCLFTTTSGTIKNVTITGNGNGRAIGAGSSGGTKQTGDLYIDNVTIDNVLYAINGNGATGNEKVIVTNSTIHGWSSYANVAEFSFTNCHLGKGNSGYGVLCTYGDTTLTNCTIDDTLVLYARNPGSNGHTIEITNCTYNGTAVTAANFAALFLNMSDSDCVYITTNMTVIVDGTQVDFT